jgi:hypothetical protein
VSLYLWAAGISSSTRDGSDVDVSFDTMFENLHMAFMGTVEARRDRWSLLGDVIYLNFGGNEAAEIPVGNVGGTIDLEADVKTRAWVLNFLGGYNLMQGKRGSVDLIAGPQYLEIKPTSSTE